MPRGQQSAPDLTPFSRRVSAALCSRDAGKGRAALLIYESNNACKYFEQGRERPSTNDVNKSSPFVHIHPLS